VPYRRKDAFYKRARTAGYRARSAYKLAELDDRFRLLRPGDFVVDLGAWPGGWLQVILERIGDRGRVVGIDLVDVPPLGTPNVVTFTGDVRDPATAQSALDLLGRRADVVLSDLSPKLTGVRATDDARFGELASATIDLLPALLRPGGRLLMKLFMSPAHEQIVARLREKFADVTITRPEATRRGSAELYAAAFDHRASPGTT
jgi:23S rRNA (uridine2552-2'-O)-methyltransferase